MLLPLFPCRSLRPVTVCLDFRRGPKGNSHTGFLIVGSLPLYLIFSYHYGPGSHTSGSAEPARGLASISSLLFFNQGAWASLTAFSFAWTSVNFISQRIYLQWSLPTSVAGCFSQAISLEVMLTKDKKATAMLSEGISSRFYSLRKLKTVTYVRVCGG